MKKKLAVFFPGRRYGVDCPLLYYSDFICKGKGYEGLYMHYAAHREENPSASIYENIENVRNYVLERLRNVSFEQYEDIVFISKSIGTVLASIAQTELQIRVRNVYFTPLEPTLPYLGEKRLNQPGENLVLAGTRDRFLEAERLKELCDRENIRICQFEGLGHSMETEDITGTLEIMGEIIKEVEGFL